MWAEGAFCKCCESSSDEVPRAESRLFLISVNIKTIISIKTLELIIKNHFTELEGKEKKKIIIISSWREKSKLNPVKMTMSEVLV